MNRIEASEWVADDAFSPWDSAALPPRTRPATAYPNGAPTTQLQHQPRHTGSGALALAAALAAQQTTRSTASDFDFSGDDPLPPRLAPLPLARVQLQQQPAQADVAAQPQAALPAALTPTPPPQPPVVPATAASFASPLSLERYLDLFQLLTKGRGVVQPPSELERSALRLGDLRAVVQARGVEELGGGG